MRDDWNASNGSNRSNGSKSWMPTRRIRIAWVTFPQHVHSVSRFFLRHFSDLSTTSALTVLMPAAKLPMRCSGRCELETDTSIAMPWTKKNKLENVIVWRRWVAHSVGWRWKECRMHHCHGDWEMKPSQVQMAVVQCAAVSQANLSKPWSRFLLISPYFGGFSHFFLFKLLLANHRVFCSSVGSLFAVKRNYCDLICLF